MDWLFPPKFSVTFDDENHRAVCHFTDPAYAAQFDALNHPPVPGELELSEGLQLDDNQPRSRSNFLQISSLLLRRDRVPRKADFPPLSRTKIKQIPSGIWKTRGSRSKGAATEIPRNAWMAVLPVCTMTERRLLHRDIRS